MVDSFHELRGSLIHDHYLRCQLVPGGLCNGYAIAGTQRHHSSPFAVDLKMF